MILRNGKIKNKKQIILIISEIKETTKKRYNLRSLYYKNYCYNKYGTSNKKI